MSDRKYRQRGYRDDDGDERPKRPQGPRPKKEGPRGRGLGAPTANVTRCAACGGKVEAPGGEVAIDASCPHCSADLHTCTHCRYFDPSARFECRQPIEAPIPKKAKRNECSLFTAKVAQETDAEKAAPGDPRAAFDALFKI